VQELDVRLFKDIAGLEIGSENDVLTFTDRLCRENNWSKPFAKRCVEEYKKFIYLAAMSDTPVTPWINTLTYLNKAHHRTYGLTAKRVFITPIGSFD